MDDTPVSLLEGSVSPRYPLVRDQCHPGVASRGIGATPVSPLWGIAVPPCPLAGLRRRCRCPLSRSVAAVLAWWHSQSDAEEILLALGFVGSEPGAASRVPPRFFSGPSRASGIDLGLFLRAQARRLQLEDPCLRLASRFQQFQALAATADAFFCLYSHVSRTPLQRIAPARPCRDIPDSAGRRLKRAVSSLCLYTGRGHGGDTPRGATPGPGGTPEGCPGDGDTDTVSPRPPRAGTAWGHPERCCPHGRRLWGRGGDTGDPRGDVTVSCRVAVTAQRPPGLRP
uniref:ITPR-interacting domain-containing protein n=1 Tax=Junco hyemalis TaxID=40217 RepID=A0A8C5JLA2_JUNHY